jgi:hypothetical protein
VKRTCSNAAALSAILVAFVVTLEIESILRPLVRPGTWLSQFIDDALTHVVYPCTIPTAVFAAWGCGQFAKRLALSLLGTAWLYLVWQIAMQVHARGVVGLGYTGFLLSYFFWTMAALIVLRWKLGVAFDCSKCGGGAAELAWWQFSLGDVCFWTAASGMTLGVGRYAFPSKNWELELSLVQVTLYSSTQIDAILQCCIVLPLLLALVFRWRWIPLAGLLTIVAIAIGIPYYAWRENATMLRVIQSVPLLATRFYFTSWPFSVLPLLIALRLAGCRLRAAPSPALASLGP